MRGPMNVKYVNMIAISLYTDTQPMYCSQCMRLFVLCISLVRVLQMFNVRHMFQSSLLSSLYWSPLELLSVITSHWTTWSTGPSMSHSQSFSCNACYTQFDHLPAVTNVLYCCCRQGQFFSQFERSVVPGNLTFNLTPVQFYYKRLQL
jgi:hypothetical protein